MVLCAHNERSLKTMPSIYGFCVYQSCSTFISLHCKCKHFFVHLLHYDHIFVKRWPFIFIRIKSLDTKKIKYQRVYWKKTNTIIINSLSSDTHDLEFESTFLNLVCAVGLPPHGLGPLFLHRIKIWCRHGLLIYLVYLSLSLHLAQCLVQDWTLICWLCWMR